MKCKFQDNLEFMQWVKRFWDQNFPGGAYDSVQRRKGGGPSSASARSPAVGRSSAVGTGAAASMARKAINNNSPAGKKRISRMFIFMYSQYYHSSKCKSYTNRQIIINQSWRGRISRCS